jgi:superfamily II helicase
MQYLTLCKQCEDKLNAQPVTNGVQLAMGLDELCDDCKKQLDKEKINGTCC